MPLWAWAPLSNLAAMVAHPSAKRSTPFYPTFFLSMAISFFVAAIGYIFVRSRSDEQAKVSFEGLTVAFFGVSTIFLVLYGLELFQITMFSPENWKKGIWWTTSVLLTAVVVYSTVEVSLAYISMLGMLVYLIITVLLLVARPKLWIAKALGTATLFASLVAQITFNHNGLFHVLYLVGIVILFRAENCNPSVMCGDGVILPMVENKIPGLRQSAL
mmetsp:Transcript_37718/g.38084  ORF Transcript_37718/g.38084 Transcript_37718/m.38084 type:complete len:216 (+) Transcript_37718:93-740(+)